MSSKWYEPVGPGRYVLRVRKTGCLVVAEKKAVELGSVHTVLEGGRNNTEYGPRFLIIFILHTRASLSLSVYLFEITRQLSIACVHLHHLQLEREVQRRPTDSDEGRRRTVEPLVVVDVGPVELVACCDV